MTDRKPLSQHSLLALFASASCLATTLPAHALTNGISTDSFTALGEIAGASGVLISANWVLTAAHVANNVSLGTGYFESTSGSSLIDAVYTVSTDVFPGNDLALIHLASALDTSAVPVLNDAVIKAVQVPSLGTLTMASAQNGTPQSMANTQAASVLTNYTTDTGARLTANWLLTSGVSQVAGGDSGSALFKGSVTDSQGSLLIGIASAALSSSSGAPESAYVQVASYKTWIDATMSASGQHAVWISAVPEVSTLPMMLLGLAGIGWLNVRKQRTA
jgi:hypothetical protein